MEAVQSLSEGDDRFARWLANMRRGAFAEAWRISDQVLHERRGRPCADLPPHERYFWDGTPLTDRRVMIRCYHGLGDTIQFVRYAPCVRAIAQSVHLAAQAELTPLLQPLTGLGIELVDDGFADFDLEVELMELPHVFRTTLATMPRQTPYIHVQPAPLQRAAKLEVGLVWRAGAGWDRRRNIPGAELAPLATVPDMRLHILQNRQDCHNLPAGLGVMSQRDQLFDLACFMRALDLVITVDSMPAHLAGALGVPVWNLLHSDPDWRWMEECERSPWYPTMRLFRQKKIADWRAVIARVTAELQRLTSSSHHQRISSNSPADRPVSVLLQDYPSSSRD